jgi:hypothetical protein
MLRIVRSKCGAPGQLDRHLGAYCVGRHVLAQAEHEDLASFHHQCLVDEFGRKVVVLLHQYDGYGLVVGQQADDAAEVLMMLACQTCSALP